VTFEDRVNLAANERLLELDGILLDQPQYLDIPVQPLGIGYQLFHLLPGFAAAAVIRHVPLPIN
jgi:hypothetical protein